MLGALLISGTLSGCSTSPTATDKNDPWESWNRDVHSFNKDFDDTILKPLAKGYKDITPNPVDESITNIFSNINDIGVTINDFLQLKFVQGGMDASRFLVNTTVGLVGAFDVAKMIDLPKHDEDFGQTLGFWGVPSGNYMVLPFLGASSPRDTVGLIGDALFNPLTYVSFFGGFAANAASAAATGVDVTDSRSDLMSSEKILNEASVDRYDFVKNSYKQRREYLIHDGNPPEENDDPLAGEALEGSATGPAANNSPNNLSNPPKPSTSAVQNPNAVIIIDNSTTMPKEAPPVPVIDNSKHLLELSAPEEENQRK
ncbi:surface lipoprotein [Methyloglobulus morosus KoM1]|uniref:Surface lipoprotein n=2 Tax=Methyloglobulus TaxID=1410680 RepID=V5C699_9GAMM|nr:surface lipoprotein [Methyloglobulus morosus KoM1]